VSHQGARIDERGFTLVEVIVTILLMGIVFAIASSMWFGAIDSRRVDSGTNRLAADLRHAHSRAINRLEPQTVTLNAGSSKYTMTGVTNPIDLDDFPDAGDDVVVPDAGLGVAFVAFCPNGSAEIPPNTTVCSAAPSGAPTTITVGSPPDPTQEPNHTIQINPVTSRIRVVP
jgi:prepilin-type N-terminal cleavage/methylation domain-containing protein